WKAVEPSASDAFTSACFSMSVCSAARSPRLAASTIGGRESAAAMPAITSINKAGKAGKAGWAGWGERSVFRPSLPCRSRLSCLACPVTLLDPSERVYGQATSAAANVIDRYVHLVHERDEQVGHHRLLGVVEMTPALDASRAAADEHQRQVVARVPLAVRNAGAVQNRRVIEQRAVAVRRRTQLRQILREQLRVVAVDLRHLRDELGDVVVMRQRVVRLGHADLRIRPRALLLADHERDHPRQVRLERQELQVEHDREVIFEHGRCALRLLERWQLELALLLGTRDAPFDVAN